MLPLFPFDTTLDTFLGGTLQVRQSRTGYRFSVDALLLSQFAKIKKYEKVIDLGTGCAILPLLLSRATTCSSFVGVEVQKSLAEVAQDNIRLNRLQGRITILQRDYRDLKGVFPAEAFDVVVSNPPYRRYRTGRMNPIAEKAVARHEVLGTLEDLIDAAGYLLPPRGRCYVIFPAMRLVDLVATLRHGKLEPKRLRFVHSRPGGAARFVLAESVKGSGVELEVMSPLILGEVAEASSGSQKRL